ncbi:ABC transporter permease [Microbulbifer thermotolerans]|uniref:Iron ABC transporter permease n=1 Tax=Microbulbifer thermotolerans TaxID=252514 RepID=A0AB35HZ28_MICTH|nr:iron ABC transporter permease [Microbulbifer thermotolerans]MCX2779930.1 iron ABC transporter permease [Microbulbifer thermotolerans]MCX2794709.1 iron ABC transporter permease [Microbulbifer thermotolerans]MCX2802812.1 iron ABC transporter permease [Microbulbifer thermotolerans]MCX2805237.1 iron ABC transporter permease [Microbulbifer thermotolerans]MCX2830899.1 iron ABC transporter permease [Microbulbifer thermotolerans]
MAAIALLVALPLLSVFWLALFPEENIWPHLLDTVLFHYISATLMLAFGVAVLTLLAGVGAAWLVTMCRFPGRGLFEWALLLPFAVPAYVIAYVYTDLLEYAGPVQKFLRALCGWQTARDYWFPEIRSMGGAIAMLSLVLYPYVYMLARAAFIEQCGSIRAASRSLGCTPWQSFLRVSLPMARPAIAVGLSLVLMETLNDFGTVDFFAVRTLSVGIYDTWLSRGNLGGAAQIACSTLVFVVLLIALERRGRKGQRHFVQSPVAGSDFYRLRGWRALSASLFCALLLISGFGVPIVVLGGYALDNFSSYWSGDFLAIARNSFLLSGAAAVVTAVLGLLLAYGKRLYPRRSVKSLVGFAKLGYAMPGAVMAIGVLIPLAAFDNALDALLREHFGISTGLLLSGSVFAIVFAYAVRFLAVSAGAIESSLDKVTPSMDRAARSLGRNSWQTLWAVHFPLVRAGLLSGALVVFVDCMKELPATLLLRPFGFETLATHVYQFASDEMLERSALGALMIVLVGLLPVILLSRSMGRRREGQVAELVESEAPTL